MAQTHQTVDHKGPIEFAGCTCELNKTTYAAGGATALFLTDLHDGGPVLTVTANVPGISERLPEGEVLVKNYSENEGVLDVLVEAGYLERTGEDFPSGFVTLNGARILA